MSKEIKSVALSGQDSKENVLLGLIGAIIGVLLGSILWVIIGQVGFIAGIAGYAIVFCGMKGYAKLGGSLSKTGIVICIILSILPIVAAEMASLKVTADRELHGLYTMAELLAEPEIIGIVIKDLAVGYILSIWASYSSIKNIWKETEANHTMP